MVSVNINDQLESGIPYIIITTYKTRPVQAGLGTSLCNLHLLSRSLLLVKLIHFTIARFLGFIKRGHKNSGERRKCNALIEVRKYLTV